MSDSSTLKLERRRGRAETMKSSVCDGQKIVEGIKVNLLT